MGINGINDYYSSMAQSYRVPISTVTDVEANRGRELRVQEIPMDAPEPGDHGEPAAGAAGKQDTKVPSVNVTDISLTFNKQDDFGYIGQDSDIRLLDMEKAISAMRRDQILQQYQYFVGSARNFVLQSAEGSAAGRF